MDKETAKQLVEQAVADNEKPTPPGCIRCKGNYYHELCKALSITDAMSISIENYVGSIVQVVWRNLDAKDIGCRALTKADCLKLSCFFARMAE